LGNTEKANTNMNELTKCVEISAQNKRIATILTSSDYKEAGAVSTTTIHKIFKKVEVAV